MSDDAPEDLASALGAAGHRLTGPRQAVWQVLVDANDHLTVDEIADRVAKIDPGVNVASIYRSLALFKDEGLARESRLGADEGSRWEVAHPDEHFHLVCDRCGKIDHHVGSLVQQIREHLSHGHGFAPDRVELTVHGTCADCATS